MGIVETTFIYLVIGLCVATATVLREEPTAIRGAFLFLGALVFWPLFAPVLLAARSGEGPVDSPIPAGSFSSRVRAAEAQLLSALGKVSGLAEDVLSPEVARVRALTGQLANMERRVQEMDELLGTPEFDQASAHSALRELLARGLAEEDPRVMSVRARLRNIERLRAMRTRTTEDLERVMLKLEEMSSQLRLLKFAGRPDEEVVKMIKEIADSVEGITEGILATG